MNLRTSTLEKAISPLIVLTQKCRLDLFKLEGPKHWPTSFVTAIRFFEEVEIQRADLTSLGKILGVH